MTTHYVAEGCLGTTLCGLGMTRLASLLGATQGAGTLECRACLREALRHLRGFARVVFCPVFG